MLPGSQTMPGLITQSRDGYIDALRKVDAAVVQAAEATDGGLMTLPDGADFITPMADTLAA